MPRGGTSCEKTLQGENNLSTYLSTGTRNHTYWDPIIAWTRRETVARGSAEERLSRGERRRVRLSVLSRVYSVFREKTELAFHPKPKGGTLLDYISKKEREGGRFPVERRLFGGNTTTTRKLGSMNSGVKPVVIRPKS